jgi:hypothetical protein
MAYRDKLLSQDAALGYRYWWAHCLSWFASAIICFSVFFFPLYVLGWWAFAFPPWLIVALTIFPVLQSGPAGGAWFQPLILPAAVWVTLAATTFTIGLIRKNIIPISIAIHSVLPPVAIVLSCYLAVELNGGQLPGTS